MKKDQSGFSIIEIIIAMVILSIVVLAMTSMVITSTRSHSAAFSGDVGGLLAREKLAELQDPTVMAIAGSDTVPRNGVSYARKWEITGSEPSLVTVSVHWMNNTSSRSTEVAGYIETGNVCQSISPNNTPSAITVTLPNGTDLAIGDTIELPLALASGTNIATLYGVDGDTIQGDAIRINFGTSGAQNSSFAITGDSLYTAEPFNTADSIYTIDIEVLDCANNSLTRTVVVHISSVVGPPKADSPQNFNPRENQTGGYLIGTLTTNEADETGITWSDNAGDFDVDPINGQVTLKSGSELNFEDNTKNNYSFTATLFKDGADSTIVVNVIVVDTNETPYDISLSKSDIAEDASAQDVVGVITVEDQDQIVPSSTFGWHNYSINESSGSGNFYVDGNQLKVTNTATLTPPSETVEITATDADFSYSESFTITITAAVIGCGGYDFYDGGTTYITNDIVAHNDRQWKNTGQWADPTYPYEGSPKWTTTGFCNTPNCSDIPDWSSSTPYDWPYGQVVDYGGKVWVCKAYASGNSGKPKSSSSKWTDLGGCN